MQQIAEYSPVESGLSELRSRMGSVVYDVTTPAGMVSARKDRRECVILRTALEEKRIALKAGILERGRLIDGEAKRIRSAIEAMEEPIDAQIKKEESRKERERVEREAKEAARITGVQETIAMINGVAPSMVGASSVAIAATLTDMRAYLIGEWAFEFKEIAQAAKDKSIATLEQLLAGAKAQEEAAAAEAKRVAEERAELARLRAEQAEREKQAAAQRAKEAAEATAARAKIEAEERASREKIEAEERAARLKREEDDRQAAIAREEERRKQQAAAAAIQAERDRVEAERRETARLQNELLDGAAMLSKFVDRFGKRREFTVVVKAIKSYLEMVAA